MEIVIVKNCTMYFITFIADNFDINYCRIDFMETLLAPAVDSACSEDIVSILNSKQEGYNAPFCGLLRGYSGKGLAQNYFTCELQLY